MVPPVSGSASRLDEQTERGYAKTQHHEPSGLALSERSATHLELAGRHAMTL